MAKNISVADEVKYILSWSDRPMTLREINDVLGNKIPTSDINRHINYWVKRGLIISRIKEGYVRTREYLLNSENIAKIPPKDFQ